MCVAGYYLNFSFKFGCIFINVPSRETMMQSFTVYVPAIGSGIELIYLAKTGRGCRWHRHCSCAQFSVVLRSVVRNCSVVRSVVRNYVQLCAVLCAIMFNKTRFNKIATQGAPQMAVDKEANSLSRVYSYYSKFNLCLFYV